jgi:hypothetical protein
MGSITPAPACLRASKVPPPMSLHAAAPALVSLAEGSNAHHSLNPIETGGGALLVLLILLFVTSRFNKDR